MRVNTRKPGDALKIRASEWNAIARVVNRDIEIGKGSRLGFSLPHGCVWIKNGTESDISRFGVMEVTTPIVNSADYPEEFYGHVAVNVAELSASDVPPGRFAVAYEPIKAGHTGRGILTGVHAISAVVTDAGHRFLRAVAGEPLLQSCAAGEIPIVSKPDGTGTLGVIASFTPAAAPLKILARLDYDAPTADGPNRWLYAWEEIILVDGEVEPGTRNSDEDGLAVNIMERLNDVTGMLGTGIETDNIPGGWSLAAIGQGPVWLHRRPDGAWAFQAENQPDGACVPEPEEPEE